MEEYIQVELSQPISRPGELLIGVGETVQIRADAYYSEDEHLLARYGNTLFTLPRSSLS